jgi:hypothetical protein
MSVESFRELTKHHLVGNSYVVLRADNSVAYLGDFIFYYGDGYFLVCGFLPGEKERAVCDDDEDDDHARAAEKSDAGPGFECLLTLSELAAKLPNGLPAVRIFNTNSGARAFAAKMTGAVH